MKIVIAFVSVALVTLLLPTDALLKTLFRADSGKATSAAELLQQMFNGNRVTGTNELEWAKKNTSIPVDLLKGLFDFFNDCANEGIINGEGSVKFLTAVTERADYNTPFFLLLVARYGDSADSISETAFKKAGLDQLCRFEVLSDGGDNINVQSMDTGLRVKDADFFNAVFIPKN